MPNNTIEKVITREEALKIFSDLINKGTRRGQFNSADMALTRITDTLCTMTEKGEIDVDELYERLDGSGYTKNLSKYVGKVKGMRLKLKKK